MEVKLEIIRKDQKESVKLRVHEVTSKVEQIIALTKEDVGFLIGEVDETKHKIPVTDVYYIEVVDRKSFIYTEKLVCQSPEKLYQLESRLTHFNFVRVGKSLLLNCQKIEKIKPTTSGRFEATLSNQERVAISRKYVPELKKGLGMEG